MTNQYGTPHYARSEQWQQIGDLAFSCDQTVANCMIELRDKLNVLVKRESVYASGLTTISDRFVAIERRIGELESKNQTLAKAARKIGDNLDRQHVTAKDLPKPNCSPAPAGELVEQVVEALNPEDPPCYHVEAAHAAILAVADWLQRRNAAASGWADIIRQEVQDHG